VTSTGRLFDVRSRTDSSPKANTESVFDFYNRVNRPDFAAVRDQLDLWYSEFPDDGDNLRNRFVSHHEHLHFGAWWELYIRTLYRRLGYEITVHPTMPNGTKPDFGVTRDGSTTYVECKTIPEKPRAPLEALILDCTNEVTHPDFMLELEIDQAATNRPSCSAIKTQLAEWLNGLNADDVLDDLTAGRDAPECPVLVNDWHLTYTAYPVDRDSRGEPGRILGVLPTANAAFIDDVGRIRKAVSKKGSKYTDLDTPLENPLIIAINTGSVFIDDGDIDQALFGSAAFTYYQNVGDTSIHEFRQRNGYWCAEPPTGTRVSAVLMGSNIAPYRVATTAPRMWINPWAPMPISDTYSLATTIAGDDGRIINTEGTLAINELFGLPADWPRRDPN
jgi:hypothetical protein